MYHYATSLFQGYVLNRAFFGHFCFNFVTIHACARLSFLAIPCGMNNAMQDEKPKLTPMMAQYMAIKNNHQDSILFYRMGDFYEMFFDDAVTAAKVLDIALTKRGKTDGTDIPMCGVPWHSHENYLARLIKAGHRVAICDQIETPDQAKARAKKEGLPVSKALVQRDVIRIVTPGTLTEDHLLDARSSNYLAGIYLDRKQGAIAWLDLSTGHFYVESVAFDRLPSTLDRIGAHEILVSQSAIQNEDLFETFIPYEDCLTVQSDSLFDSKNADSFLCDLYKTDTLESFGSFSKIEITIAGALADYAQRTQKGSLPYIRPIIRHTSGSVMDIDGATRRNLEITQTVNGDKQGSLLNTIDRTITSGGGRLLQNYLSAPATVIDELHQRQSRITALLDHANLRETIHGILKSVPDMERALSRLTVGRGGPRDMAAIRDGLIASESLRSLFLSHKDIGQPFESICEALNFDHNESAFIDRLKQALKDDLPFLTRDGGFIAEGFSPQLDEQRALSKDSKTVMAKMQTEYAEKTGVSGLKITHNNVLGYFVEVTAKNADKLMVMGADNDNNALKSDNPFVHRQTLANVVRFTTPELSDLERNISKASEVALAIEMEIFNQFIIDIQKLAGTIGDKAVAIAAIDVAYGLAVLADDQSYCCPVLTDGYDFQIINGRHPVVEAALRKNNNQKFAPNDSDLSGTQQLWLLTGPNMAGKSTFLRQNAIIALMAQIGSYVPADQATIGIVDKIFSRVGASDDLARGRSTFMVEMVETAAILNQATDKSLVILDEIGRGTATFDGLSIAWATLEYLHDICQCRGLFATHYHELTKLSSKLDRAEAFSMAVKEWKGDIIFLHEVVKGAADHSYGVHVAKLAGLPAPVITRAKQILKQLEASETSGALAKLADDLPLFSNVIEQVETDKQADDLHTLATMIKDINPDELSPKEALEMLYTLKKHSGF